MARETISHVARTKKPNAFILAMAFNDYGVTQSTASMVLSKYESSDFTSNEINTTIKSAYSNTQNFNTKFYEDDEKINDIQQRLRRGESKSNSSRPPGVELGD